MNRSRRRHSERDAGLLTAALQWAQGEGFFEEKLPRGRRDSVDDCPLARATGYFIAGDYYSPTQDGPLEWLSLPTKVAIFAALFDKGRYPELTER